MFAVVLCLFGLCLVAVRFVFSLLVRRLLVVWLLFVLFPVCVRWLLGLCFLCLLLFCLCPVACSAFVGLFFGWCPLLLCWCLVTVLCVCCGSLVCVFLVLGSCGWLSFFVFGGVWVGVWLSGGCLVSFWFVFVAVCLLGGVFAGCFVIFVAVWLVFGGCSVGVRCVFCPCSVGVWLVVRLGLWLVFGCCLVVVRWLFCGCCSFAVLWLFRVLFACCLVCAFPGVSAAVLLLFVCCLFVFGV